MRLNSRTERCTINCEPIEKSRKDGCKYNCVVFTVYNEAVLMTSQEFAKLLSLEFCELTKNFVASNASQKVE